MELKLNFLRDLKSFGYNLQALDIIELRIHGVSSEFVGGLQAGYDLAAKQITELRIHGVDSEYLRQLRAMDRNLGQQNWCSCESTACKPTSFRRPRI